MRGPPVSFSVYFLPQRRNNNISDWWNPELWFSLDSVLKCHAEVHRHRPRTHRKVWAWADLQQLGGYDESCEITDLIWTDISSVPHLALAIMIYLIPIFLLNWFWAWSSEKISLSFHKSHHFSLCFVPLFLCFKGLSHLRLN